MPKCLSDVADPNSIVPCNPKGYYCPRTPPQSCFGTDGLDIVDSVGVTYDVFTSEDLLVRNMGIVVGIGVFWRLVYLVQMVRLCNATEEPQMPSAAPAAVGETKLQPLSPSLSESESTTAVNPKADASSATPPVAAPSPATAAGCFAFLDCSYVLHVNAEGKRPLVPGSAGPAREVPA